VLTGRRGGAIHQAMWTGAFATHVIAGASQVAVIPTSLPLDAASLLGCGVITGVGAVLNTAAVEAGSTVVVLGAGGVGLNCVQGALLAGAQQIVAADVIAPKLDAARAFGATHVIDVTAADPRDAVRGLTGGRGADYVFAAAGHGSVIEAGAAMLRRGGTLVLVGIPAAGTTVSLDPVAIADGSLRVLGSKLGAARPQEDIPKLAGLYLAGRLKLDELISERYEFDRVNDAIESARDGKLLRAVVTFPP
jgi:Zn-dependent alcohol dehydrogenase